MVQRHSYNTTYAKHCITTEFDRKCDTNNEVKNNYCTNHCIMTNISASCSGTIQRAKQYVVCKFLYRDVVQSCMVSVKCYIMNKRNPLILE